MLTKTTDISEIKKISSAAICRAEKIMRSETNLAAKINTTKQNLNYWKSHSLIPYEKAVEIHVVTYGLVNVNELRPDLKYLTKNFISLVLKTFE